jgi:hypothetical protein
MEMVIVSAKEIYIETFRSTNSRCSLVITVSDYRLDGRGSIPDRGGGFFLLPFGSRPALGPTQPPIQWVPGALSPGVKSAAGA